MGLDDAKFAELAKDIEEKEVLWRKVYQFKVVDKAKGWTEISKKYQIDVEKLKIFVGNRRRAWQNPIYAVASAENELFRFLEDSRNDPEKVLELEDENANKKFCEQLKTHKILWIRRHDKTLTVKYKDSFQVFSDEIDKIGKLTIISANFLNFFDGFVLLIEKGTENAIKYGIKYLRKTGQYLQDVYGDRT